jgi:hypothetical protein
MSSVMQLGIQDSVELRKMSIDNARMALQQSRMAFEDYLKQYPLEIKDNKLKIKNIHKLIGNVYDDRLFVVGVLEEDKYYQFTLNSNKLNQPEIILLHRRQTDSGHYIMEYKTKTLWLERSEFDTPDKLISIMRKI